MRRKTFLTSGLSAAAAVSVPGLTSSITNVLAREASAKTTISWWGWGDPPVNSAVTGLPNQHNSPNDAVKVFYEKSHPGVTIDTTVYNYPDYVTALKTSFAGGNAPDTVELEPGPLVSKYASYMQPLDGLAAKRWGPNWKDQFYPLAISQTLAADPLHKSMFALPVGLECGTGLYYNTAIFSKYNLKPPQSYAELKAIADILNGHGIIPISWGAKDGWPNFDWLRMLVEQTAPGVWDSALQGKAKFTHPGFVQALQILVRMQKDRIFSSSIWGTTAYPEAITLFQSGKAAMYNSGTWDLAGFAAPTTKIRNTLGVMPLPPMGQGLQKGRLWATTNMMTSISKSAKNVQAAFDFIAWQADAGQKASWVDKSGFLPSRKGMAPQPQPNAHYQAIEAYFLKEISHAVVRYGAQLTADLQKATEDAIANVSTLGMDPLRALNAVQAAHDKSVKR
ncbi:MAG: putative ABC-type sugar transport system, periplasmic component [Chloroflexi bacterium]|nr:putative ABC-type sugar transport system, periplasmic component [Chloroflexota bacterium]